jgi:S-adenosylmethionine decarboxylase
LEELGKHYLCEVFGCNSNILNDETNLVLLIEHAINRAGATLLNIASHKFEPQGVTIVALLSESHISIHTWPENGSAAIDVFTCGNAKPELAINFLIDELKPVKYNKNFVQR